MFHPLSKRMRAPQNERQRQCRMYESSPIRMAMTCGDFTLIELIIVISTPTLQQNIDPNGWGTKVIGIFSPSSKRHSGGSNILFVTGQVRRPPFLSLLKKKGFQNNEFSTKAEGF